MSGVSFGVLAEDDTDCAAVGVLVRRAAREVSDLPVGLRRFAAAGCSKLKRKAEPQIRAMAREGCAAAILVHDLDRNPDNSQLNDEAALRAQLEAIAVPAGLARLICIPVEELEAWFWSDPAVVEEVGRGKGKAHPSPHLIARPKEALIRLSMAGDKKPRYSTNDNPKLAAKLDLDLCAKHCRAFRDLRAFVHETLVGSGRRPAG